MTPYRLASYTDAEGPRAGVVLGDVLFDAAELLGDPLCRSVIGILADWNSADPRIRTALSRAGIGRPLSQIQLLAPVLWPSAIYCAGMNYRDHAAEMARRLGREPDADPKRALGAPWHFLKAPGSLVGPGATVAACGYSAALDWEAELAAVIGKTCRNAKIEDALGYVAGYTIANDLSARDRSRRAGAAPASPFHYDWIGQKSFDGACPLGPFLVPACDVPDPQSLSIRLWVNGSLKQDSNTKEMIFTLAEQIAHLSAGMTLHPGDIILTGTPAGVGAGRGEFLKSGDTVRIEIERLGTLITRLA